MEYVIAMKCFSTSLPRISHLPISITQNVRLYIFQSELLRPSDGIIGCRFDYVKGIMRK